MVDYLTKWCEAVPVKQQDARTIASVIVSEWVSRYGVPVILHSDQGPAFESYLLREICAFLGIHKTRTTPYHPEGNGLVERTNRTIKKILTTFVDRYEGERWDEHIPLCMLAYRAATHESTGYAPAFLQLGHDLRLPSDADTPVVPADLVGSNEYARSLRERLFAALQIARENIGHAQQHQKTVYDRRSHGPVYEVGDYVLLHRPKAPPGAPAKFHHVWQGPYVIVIKRPNNTYVIRDPSQPHADVQCVHYNQLKPYPPPRPDAQPSTSSYLPPVSHTAEISTSNTNTLSEH
ncbi:gap-Pol polyprotein [Clonorchis sinensis]|uniref:Gap-Pol polyprotein n=1 Tax=Clonorchis sinensis TaxID=79923 RepID=G7YPA6_CLOSI|nr:gap-Pol polyprotein [Clonorchis sinensis]